MSSNHVVEILFSPTGGTRKVADLLCNALGKITQKINLTQYGIDFSQISISENALVVIAAPVFEAVIPDVVIERIRQLNGNHANCVVIAVYGNRAYDDGLIQLKDTAKACNFNVIAAVAAVAEHSIMRQFGTGRPDKEDACQLQDFAQIILQKLTANPEHTDYHVPGNHEYKKIGNLNVVPEATEACTGCGKCADVCPTGAIDKKNLKTGDCNKCISCMGCIAACPENARKLSDAFLAAASVKMKDLLSGRKPNEIFY